MNRRDFFKAAPAALAFPTGDAEAIKPYKTYAVEVKVGDLTITENKDRRFLGQISRRSHSIELRQIFTVTETYQNKKGETKTFPWFCRLFGRWYPQQGGGYNSACGDFFCQPEDGDIGNLEGFVRIYTAHTKNLTEAEKQYPLMPPTPTENPFTKEQLLKFAAAAIYDARRSRIVSRVKNKVMKQTEKALQAGEELRIHIEKVKKT